MICYRNLALLIFLFIALNLKQVECFSSGIVACSPSIVGETSATLQIQLTTTTTIPSSGKIKIELPTEVSISTTSPTCSMSGDVSITSLTCSYVTSTRFLTVTLSSSISSGKTVEIKASNFYTPSSTAETSTFKAYAYGTDGTTLAESLTSGITLTVSADTLTSGSVSLTDGTVGASTKATISIVSSNAMPIGGIIKVTFPKWNPSASSSAQVAMVSYTTCASVSNIDSISCSWDSSTDTLSVSGFTSVKTAGKTISFSVTNIKNPISQSPISITINTYTSGSAGQIDSGTATITATSRASITTAAVNAEDTEEVQEKASIKLEFTNPLPLNKYAIITITFPSLFTLDKSLLTEINLYGLQSYKTLSDDDFILDTSSGTVQIKNYTTYYNAAGASGKIVFNYVQNPDYVLTTGSFQIELSDGDGYEIASISSGITYTPTVGDISTYTFSADDLTVNAETLLNIEFSLPHSLTQSNSKLVINLPSIIISTVTDCTDAISSFSGFSTSMECSYDSSIEQFEFTNLFDSAYSSEATQTIVFSITQPSSVQPVEGITISSYELVSGTYYLVDQLISTAALYQVEADQFLSQSVSTEAETTYSPGVFTFTLTTSNPIPEAGYITVTFPSEISMYSSSITCIGITNMNSSPTCTKATVSSKIVITIKDAFDSDISANTILSFSLSTLRTPDSTKTSSTFLISSYDGDDYEIDEITSLCQVTMITPISISSVSAITSENIVSEYSSITLSFKTPLPFTSNDILNVYFPDEVTAPNNTDLSCTGSGVLSSTQTCSASGQTVTVTLSVKSTVSVNSVVTLKIRKAKNPGSTKESSEFTLLLTDSDGYSMARASTGNGAKIKVGLPASITEGNLTAFDHRQFAYTTMTVSMVLANDLSSGSYLNVSFDQIYFKFNDTENIVCTSNLVQNVTCTFLTNKFFQVTNIFTTDYSAGTLVTFTINNCYIDISKKMVSESWVVTTITSEGYAVDRMDTGLSLTFNCQAPCQTCASNNPTSCLSCNSLTGRYINYNSKCYSQCPDGLYVNQYDECSACDSRCATCKSDNPTYCTSCNVNSDYPYLSGNTCIDNCPFGTFQNSVTAKCQSCSSNCESCALSASTCLSCDQKSDYKYLFNNTCRTTCPTGYAVPADSTDNVCQQCDSNCLQCNGTTTYCTSCKSSLKLSYQDNTCVSSCPVGTTVYSSTTKACQTCDSKCKTCTGKTTFCSSCPDNMYLMQTTGKCVGQCSSTNKMVAVNGVCQNCDSSCLTCKNSQTACDTCASGKHLYNFTCVSTCPDGYEVSDNNQCILYGLQCAFGYEVNAMGNGCLLMLQVCQSGYKLNIAKDRCIPGPGEFVPFPLCFACIFLGLLVFASWIKYKQTLVATNIIACISFIETVGIIVQVVLSYQMGVYSTFGLSVLAILFMYGCNLFFCLIFLKQVQSDPAFKYWSQNYSKTQTIVLILGGLVNFKIFRVIYGRYFGKDNFNAAFDDYDSFFKPFTFISVFSVLTTMVPILVGNIIGLVFIEFGYQVQMNCIELTIIELVLLGLMIYEKIKMKKLVMQSKDYYKINPKFIDGSDNVMSVMDDSSMQSFHSLKTMINKKQKEKSNPLFKEYYERRRHLEKLISTILSKVGPSKQEETTEEHIVKLQEQEMLRVQMRMCRSFKDLRTIDEDFGDAEANDPELQNFISEPNSPREKEMLHNPRFVGSVMEFKRAVKNRDQFDNVYAESRPLHHFPMKTCKLITVKTQTNIMELLAIDDSVNYRRIPRRQDYISEEDFVEENLNPDYARNLLDEVVDNLHDHEFKKQRRRLHKNRLKEIPNFDLHDIQGDFIIDEEGNNVIVRGKDGKLNDREGRRVNKRGYLIDIDGNVITENGTMIFKKDEVDSDGEIPAPFCFEKKKQYLFKIQNIGAYKQNQKKKNVEDKEDDIEREYRMLKQKNASNRSSVDSLIGETPSKYNKKNKRFVPGDEDGFLSKIVQPMQAKTKSELMSKGTASTNKVGTKRPNTLENTQASIGNDYNNGVESESTKKVGRNNQTLDEFTARGLSFSGVRGKNRPTLQPFTQQTQESSEFRGTDYNFNFERISKINKLKNSLGANKEDRALKQQLDKYEKLMLGTAKDAKGGKDLAKKNLAKVYGKVQDRMSIMFDANQTQLSNRHRAAVNSSLFDTDDDIIKQRDINTRQTNRPTIATTKGQDSRMKDLESIYMKQKPPTGLSRLQKGKQSVGQETDVSSTHQLRHRALQHSYADTTGVESSDQDEMRLRKEIDKMQAILDKEQNMKRQNTSSQMKKNNKNIMGSKQKDILKGGWI